MIYADIDYEVKKMLWNGDRACDIARQLEMPVAAVYNIKAGRRGYYVEWPDGSTGEMPLERAVAISKLAKGKGRHAALQKTYDMVVEGSKHIPESSAEVNLADESPYTQYEERMDAVLEHYRKGRAVKNGVVQYDEEILPLIKKKNALIDLRDEWESGDDGYPTEAEFAYVCQALEATVKRLLGN